MYFARNELSGEVLPQYLHLLTVVVLLSSSSSSSSLSVFVQSFLCLFVCDDGLASVAAAGVAGSGVCGVHRGGEHCVAECVEGE